MAALFQAQPMDGNNKRVKTAQGYFNPSSAFATPHRAGSSHRSTAGSQTGKPLIPGSDDPAPPFYPLAAAGCQAKHTTFPSRLRLGTTSLVQPIYTAASLSSRPTDRAISPSGYDSPVVASGTIRAKSNTGPPGSNYFGGPGVSGSATELGKRVRKVVNYAEIEARHDEIDEDSEEEEDGQIRGTVRSRLLAGNRKMASGTATPLGGAATAAVIAARMEAERKRREEEELRSKMFGDGKVYLAEAPPAEFIQVQRRERRTTSVAPTAEELAGAANEHCGLIPIRVEFETETLRIRDCFTWNMNERLISPEVFAHAFCLDIDIPREPYMRTIVDQIKTQLEEATHVAEVQLVPDAKILPTGSGAQDIIEPDLRVIINLDLQIETLHLTDRIEWDLSSPLSPELFTAQYVLDLGLPHSGAPIIAHAIHEDLLRHKREVIETGLVGAPPPRADADGLIRTNGQFGIRGPKRLEGAWREWQDARSYGPVVEEWTLDEIEAYEYEKDRANKRARRDLPRPAGRRR